ncbi:hypothetical protein DOY81_007908 [Sarcophaga bullata]|nr:hypothetical protein DOY81_007908 [Sarcophaga bullata]
MFKLIAFVFAAFLALAAARPGYLSSYSSHVVQPVVKTHYAAVPVVKHVVTPVVQTAVVATPVVHTVATPVVHAVAAPIVHPVHHSYAAVPIVLVFAALLAVAAARPSHLVSSPVVYTSQVVQPVVRTHYATVPVVRQVVTPVVHTVATPVVQTVHTVGTPVVQPLYHSYSSVPLVCIFAILFAMASARPSYVAAPLVYPHYPVVRPVYTVPIVKSYYTAPIIVLVFAALLAVAAARPSHLVSSPVVYTSQVVQPVVRTHYATVPVVRQVVTPVVHTVATPVVQTVHTVGTPVVQPLYHSYSSNCSKVFCLQGNILKENINSIKMYKLFVLAALIAVAVARPSYLASSPIVYSAPTYVQEPALATVGHVVKSVPTAVSHQSISQVHSSAHYVEPIVAPVVKTTYTAPVIKTYAAPVVHTSYAAAPVLKTYAATAPVLKTYAAAAPLYHSYSAGPVLKSYAPTYGAAYSQCYLFCVSKFGKIIQNEQ